ncbi:unnamed protein product [Cochlearia groenlandica]
MLVIDYADYGCYKLRSGVTLCLKFSFQISGLNGGERMLTEVAAARYPIWSLFFGSPEFGGESTSKHSSQARHEVTLLKRQGVIDFTCCVIRPKA